MISILII